MKNKDSKNGVLCDVDDCVHNIDGCNCNATKIKVTKGNTIDAHFCKTFTDKKKTSSCSK